MEVCPHPWPAFSSSLLCAKRFEGRAWLPGRRAEAAPSTDMSLRTGGLGVSHRRRRSTFFQKAPYIVKLYKAPPKYFQKSPSAMTAEGSPFHARLRRPATQPRRRVRSSAPPDLPPRCPAGSFLPRPPAAPRHRHRRGPAGGDRRRSTQSAFGKINTSWLVGWQAAGWLPPAPLVALAKLSGRAAPTLSRPACRNAAAVRAPRAHRPPRDPANPRRSRRPELSSCPPGRGASPRAARRGRPARVPPLRRLGPIRQSRRRLEVLSTALLLLLIS